MHLIIPRTRAREERKSLASRQPEIPAEYNGSADVAQTICQSLARQITRKNRASDDFTAAAAQFFFYLTRFITRALGEIITIKIVCQQQRRRFIVVAGIRRHNARVITTFFFLLNAQLYIYICIILFRE